MIDRLRNKTPKKYMVIAVVLFVACLVIMGVDLYDTEKVGSVLQSLELIMAMVSGVLLLFQEKSK